MRWCRCALLLLFLQAGSASAQILNVVPFLSCVEPIPGGIRAYFGYESLETSPVSIFVGPDNFFTPAPGNRGQVSLFYPGYFEKAFRVTYQFSSGPVLTWNLQGVPAIATINSPLCSSPNTTVETTLAVISGGGQSTSVNTAFAQPLRVRARVNGRPIAGLQLRFVAPASGASVTFTPSNGQVVTDANGDALINATANAMAGTYSVQVRVGLGDSPLTSVNLTLTNSP